MRMMVSSSRRPGPTTASARFYPPWFSATGGPF